MYVLQYSNNYLYKVNLLSIKCNFFIYIFLILPLYKTIEKIKSIANKIITKNKIQSIAEFKGFNKPFIFACLLTDRSLIDESINNVSIEKKIAEKVSKIVAIYLKSICLVSLYNDKMISLCFVEVDKEIRLSKNLDSSYCKINISVIIDNALMTRNIF